MREIIENHKTIAVDCDEVLVELVDKAIALDKSKITKLIWKKEDIKDYYLSNYLDISLEEAVDFFKKALYDDFEKLELKKMDFAFEWVKTLKQEWKDLQIVTARSEAFEEYTKKYIEKNFPNIFSDIHFGRHFTENSKNKSEICKEIWASLIIEDNFDYALECAKNGIEAILLEKPWNTWRQEKHKNIHRIKSWKDLI